MRGEERRGEERRGEERLVLRFKFYVLSIQIPGYTNSRIPNIVDGMMG